MANFSLKEKSILVGLYFSKFDQNGLNVLGFGSFTEAFNVIGLALSVQPRSLKNYRDEFDPLFPNNRKGWHKRQMREYCKKIYVDFSSLSMREFTVLLKQMLYKDHELDILIEDVDATGDEETGAFAKRLLTGQAAEQYFLDTYKSVPAFSDLELKDATKLGCGFDFKLFSPQVSFAVEVKGINALHGSIMLTDKEHNVASKMKDRYFLFVVKNFKEKPLHELYKNPLDGSLVFNKVEQQIVQTNWTTRL